MSDIKKNIPKTKGLKPEIKNKIYDDVISDVVNLLLKKEKNRKEEIERLLRVPSSDSDICYYSVVILCYYGFKNEAFYLINRVLKENPSARLHMALGDIYYFFFGPKNNRDLALENYEIAKKNDELDYGLADVLSDLHLIILETIAKMDTDNVELKQCVTKMITGGFYTLMNCYGSFEAGVKLANIYVDGLYDVGVDKHQAIRYLNTTIDEIENVREDRPTFDKVWAGKAYNNLGCLFFNYESKDCPENENAFDNFYEALLLGEPDAYDNLLKMKKNGFVLNKFNEATEDALENYKQTKIK